MLNNNLRSPEIIPLLTKPEPTITILREEYKELLIIKGKYEESQKKEGPNLSNQTPRIYKCDHSLNKRCTKKNCSINGGVCEYTTDKEYSQNQNLKIGDTVKIYQDKYRIDHKITEVLILRDGSRLFKLDDCSDKWFTEEDIIK